MRAAILGATSGMGRALARRMAERGDRLFLLGRNLDGLERSAADLRVRTSRGDAGPDPVAGFARCDLGEPSTFEPALDAAIETLESLDAVIVTAGQFATQEEIEDDPELARRLSVINFAHTVGLCEHARRRLLDGGGGTLCVFSSVAGDRPRKPVVVYGAGKAGLSAYLDGLDLRYRDQGLVTVCVKPGFVRTAMTEGLDAPPFAGDPDDVASRVLRGIDRGTRVVYAPAVWRSILAIIRRLPRPILRRADF